MRDPQPEEIRVLRALRQVDAITAAQFDAARALLEGSQLCMRCGGAGYLEVVATEAGSILGDGTESHDLVSARPCPRCEGTGQERTIR